MANVPNSTAALIAAASITMNNYDAEKKCVTCDGEDCKCENPALVQKGDVLEKLVIKEGRRERTIENAEVLGFLTGNREVPRGVTTIYDSVPTYMHDLEGDGHFGMVDELLTVTAIVIKIHKGEECLKDPACECAEGCEDCPGKCEGTCPEECCAEGCIAEGCEKCAECPACTPVMDTCPSKVIKVADIRCIKVKTDKE